MSGALAARADVADVIADAVRLLELPAFRSLVDSHEGGFSFDAGTVVSRLMSAYVGMVRADDDLTALIEVATKLTRANSPSLFVDELSAALARVGGAA